MYESFCTGPYYKSQKWEQEYIDISLKITKNIYNENYKDNSSIITNNSLLKENYQDDFFGIFDEIDDSYCEDELEEYLKKPAVSIKTDPLQWWKVKKDILDYY